MLILLAIGAVSFVGLSSLIIDSWVQGDFYKEPVWSNHEVSEHTDWYDDDDPIEDNSDLIEYH